MVHEIRAENHFFSLSFCHRPCSHPNKTGRLACEQSKIMIIIIYLISYREASVYSPILTGNDIKFQGCINHHDLFNKQDIIGGV